MLSLLLLLPVAGVTVSPSAVVAGAAARVRVMAAAPPSAEFEGQRLRFTCPGPRQPCEALLAIPVEAAPGPRQVCVRADGVPVCGEFSVRARSAPVSTIRVPKRMVVPPEELKERLAQEDAAIAQAYRDPQFKAQNIPRAHSPVRGKASGVFGSKREYRDETDGTLLKESFHTGTDFQALRGTPVHPVAPGRVVLAQETYYCGKTVIVDHGLGLFTASCHLDSLKVRVGDQVTPEKLLGKSGSTGRATGPHLHLTVRVNGVPVDFASVR